MRVLRFAGSGRFFALVGLFVIVSCGDDHRPATETDASSIGGYYALSVALVGTATDTVPVRGRIKLVADTDSTFFGRFSLHNLPDGLRQQLGRGRITNGSVAAGNATFTFEDAGRTAVFPAAELARDGVSQGELQAKEFGTETSSPATLSRLRPLREGVHSNSQGYTTGGHQRCGTSGRNAPGRWDRRKSLPENRSVMVHAPESRGSLAAASGGRTQLAAACLGSWRVRQL